jgi:metal transporter CNNM
LLLSTLLISNASANESLPIFLHLLVPAWAAVLISSIFVVLFGEVVPSAFTTGPHQLTIAIKLIPYVKVLQSVLYIICYPLSLFLDWILGIHEQTRYPIRDLRALLQLHAQVVENPELPHMATNTFALEHSKNPLSNEEILLINSLMDLRVDVVTKQSIEI